MRWVAAKVVFGIGLLPLLAILTPLVPAADEVVLIPPGWVMDRGAGAINGSRLILAIHGIRKPSITRLVQIEDDRTIYTEVNGWCTWLELSPDDKHILATYMQRRGGAPGPSRFYLIDAEGNIVWESGDPQRPRFSTTGERFYRIAPTPTGSTNLELFGLDGRLMTKHELHRPLHDLIVVGSGEEVIGLYKPKRAGPAILERSALGGEAASSFRIEIDPRTIAQAFLRRIDHETLLIDHASGFITVRLDGRLYRFLPEALAAADPDQDVEYYRGFKPHQGPRPGTLLLESELSTLLLNLSSGEIQDSEVRLKSYFPWRVRDRRMLIFRPKDVVIRPLTGGE